MKKNQDSIKSVSEIIKLINNQQFNIAEKELIKVIKIKKENYYPYYLLGNIYALQKKIFWSTWSIKIILQIKFKW